MSNRPTPAQDYAVHVVESNPGIVQSHLAAIVGPHESNMYGTRTILRAVDAGRLHRCVNPERKGSWIYFTPDDTPEDAIVDNEVRAY